MLNIKPYGILHDKDALLLLVRKDEQLSQLVDYAVSHTGQVPLETMHITLCRGTKNRLKKFYMPKSIPVEDNVLCVSREDKSSCFLEVTDEGSIILDNVLRQVLGESFLEPERKYHLSITNLKGTAEASIGKVWEYEKIAI